MNARTILLMSLLCLGSNMSWAEAEVIDESDNYALSEAMDDPVMPEIRAQDQLAFNDKQNPDAVKQDWNEEAPLARDDQQASDAGTQVASAPTADMLNQIQSLRQEVENLRGQLEVQAHDLKSLQTQQTTTPQTNNAVASRPSSDLDLRPKTAMGRVNPASEQITYLAAYELIKNKQDAQAIMAMTSFVQKYPQGGYTPNAEYWLGELYLAKRDYQQALVHFGVVLNQFPKSGKSAASLLKSGYAHLYLGNKDQAKSILEQVLRTYPETPTARLATAKLNTI